jgi:intracellular septation protein A
MSTDLQLQQAGPDRSRLRSLVPIAVFDIAGPLAVYWLARMAGAAQVMALITSGIVPAIGIGYGILRNRHVSAIGILVLAGIVVGTGLGLVTHDPKLVLMEGSVPTLIMGAGCLASLLTGRPLMFRIIAETIGADSPRGQLLQQAWTRPEARPLFARITVVWGITYLAEVIARIVIVETFSTGSALLLLKVMPYLLTFLLLRWTMRRIHDCPAFAGFVRTAASTRRTVGSTSRTAPAAGIASAAAGPTAAPADASGSAAAERAPAMAGRG